MSEDDTRVNIYRAPTSSPELIQSLLRRVCWPAVRQRSRRHPSGSRPRLTLLGCRFCAQPENLWTHSVPWILEIPPCLTTTHQTSQALPFLALSWPMYGASKRISHAIIVCPGVSLAWTRPLYLEVTMLLWEMIIQICLLSFRSSSAKPSMICLRVNQMYRAAMTSLLERTWEGLIIARVHSHTESRPSQSCLRRALPAL